MAAVEQDQGYLRDTRWGVHSPRGPPVGSRVPSYNIISPSWQIITSFCCTTSDPRPANIIFPILSHFFGKSERLKHYNSSPPPRVVKRPRGKPLRLSAGGHFPSCFCQWRSRWSDVTQLRHIRKAPLLLLLRSRAHWLPHQVRIAQQTPFGHL